MNITLFSQLLQVVDRKHFKSFVVEPNHECIFSSNSFYQQSALNAAQIYSSASYKEEKKHPINNN